ncbi:MAG: flagellar protein FlgN [Clostridium sp.]|nr:flagellar protein FlgN [Clostridium sp.]MCM1398894.1 flagellar protein FlgN [Clostridium sp.]MCM1458752.1 flagellar protein FlgN [Bacteroides sp.]
MASLIENLITQMNEEYAVYEKLLEASSEKTSAIVANNLDRLKEATDKEQLLADTIAGLAASRRETMDNIATVLNKSKEDLKVTDIIQFLDAQPEFRDPLAAINEKLAKLARRLKEINSHNQNLIIESLSMIEYNINLLQNLNRAPETAEYSKDMFKGHDGYTGSAAVPGAGKFDAKQ